MSFLIDIKTSFPKYFYSQEELTHSLLKLWEGKVQNLSRLENLQKNVLVNSRHLSMPLEDYFKDLNFEERNNIFIKESLDLVEKATKDILDEYELKPSDISCLMSNTVTGFAIPSLEARLMNRFDFLPQTKRYPLMGLGCMAGVAGIHRATDYLKGHPTEAVLFFSVECCSLTFQMKDMSVANLLSTGLFGDGAACALLVGDEHPLKEKAKLKIENYESLFFPETEDVMGWSVGQTGLKIVLNKNVPDVTENQLAPGLKSFLDRNKIPLEEVKSHFAHPGGPKVLSAMESVLGLPDKGLKHSWASLSENGNMSSVSVLDITKRTIEERRHDESRHGELGIAVAMGPAFSAEMGLWRWI